MNLSAHLDTQFRLAGMNDLPAIVEIYNSTIAGKMSTADTEPQSVQSRQEWFREHDPAKRPLWVLEGASGMIGWISLQSFYGRPAYDQTAEISIYIGEKYRGKGMGSKSLEYAISQGNTLGIRSLVGFIFAHNMASIRLFEKFGFDRWGFLPRIAILDGEEKSLLILGKRLKP
ncbi:MAG TPA: GNAT family N-acetyltransferase [Chitinophagaceae bacterium]|nr:GNAT family N-acetyltransferase [Chitinophagaceae bacterium]